MKSGKLVVFAILGLVVLGYAIFELAGKPDSAVKTRDAYAHTQGAAGGDTKARRPGRQGASERAPAAGAKHSRVVPVNTEPPPPPPPPMPLDEARKQYKDYIDELQSVKDEGRALTNDEWTEYYRRGNEVLDPLVRALDSAKPAEAQEVDDSHRRFRELIMGMEPTTAAAAAAGGPPGTASPPQ